MSGLGVCLDAAPGAASFRDRAAADWAKELGRVLASPGKTVVAVDLDNLARKGGLLDPLKAQGLEVVGRTIDRRRSTAGLPEQVRQ